MMVAAGLWAHHFSIFACTVDPPPPVLRKPKLKDDGKIGVRLELKCTDRDKFEQFVEQLVGCDEPVRTTLMGVAPNI